MKITESAFYKKIIDGDGIPSKRAELASKQLSKAYIKKLNEFDDKIDNKELEAMNLLDLGPEHNTSLRPVDPGFNPDKLVESHVSILLAVEELKFKRKHTFDAYVQVFGAEYANATFKLNSNEQA